jgi:predicted component of type VI protein secretion system
MSFRLSPLIRGSAPSIVLQRPVLLIGRHDECDVRINSPKVSRRHCCLAMAYDRVLIRDLGSRNGVRVNGREIDESRLYEGDELAIGPILFRLEALDDNPETIGAPASRRAPSPPQPPAAAIPVPPSNRPATAGPGRSSRPDSDIDLVALDDD